MKLTTVMMGLVALAVMSAASAAGYTLTTDSSRNGWSGHKHVGPGGFSDTWSFSIPSLSNATGAVQAWNVANARFEVQHISDFRAGLYTTSGPVGKSFRPWSGGNLLAGSALSSPGDYWVGVLGTADGRAGGRYTVRLPVSPVPEPESYLMMLAGLGVIVTVARGRLKS